MKLITETNFTELIQEKTEEGDLFIEGVFLQSEKKNRNGRIYPVKVLEGQVQKYISEQIDTHRAIGELNHPTSPSVNPERASHLTTALRREGYNFIGKAKILNTPQGNIVRGLLEGGVSLGVSSRGLGSLKEGTGMHRGSKIIQKDYKLVTIDVVSNPSAPDAFVEGIYEGVDYMIRNGEVCKACEEVTLDNYKLILKKKKGSSKNEMKRNLDNIMTKGMLAEQRAKLLIDFIGKLEYQE